MNRFAKTLAATALVAGASSLSAFAATVTFASGANTVLYTNQNGSGTAVVVPSTPYPNAIAGASWISYDPDTQTKGDPNFVTEYSLTLTGDLTGYTGSITVGSDDTANVYLNGVSIGATVLPNDTLATFSNLTFGATNVFTFNVSNSGGGPTGLDFAGSATNVTPEPSSLILLGSGLVSAAGMVIRKRRVQA